MAKQPQKVESSAVDPNGADVTLATQTTLAAIYAALYADTGWISLRANYTAAQTDTAVVTASGGQFILVRNVEILADAANSVKPLARLGFGASTTPTTTGVVATHPGIPAGGGIAIYRGSGGVIGASGDDLRFTCAVPTGGSLDVRCDYKII